MTVPLPSWRPSVVWIGAAVLTLAYFHFYFSARELPGVGPGWWGWFDQSMYLRSAKAFAAGDLAPAQHWYPPGYALLMAAFLRLHFGDHAPVLIDLAGLLGTFVAFVGFARFCRVGTVAAVLIFVVANVWDFTVFREWALPWNTTPAACLVWAVLLLCACWLHQRREPILLGLAAGLVPLFRPTELAPVGVALAFVLAADWRAGELRWRALVTLGLAAAVPLALDLALHLMIYGPHPSQYMVNSRDLGFTLYDFGWKAYVLLVDPYQWFTDGQSFLDRLPWAGLALAGGIAALVEGGTMTLLALTLLAHLVLYLSYLDLLPTGLWRYNNVHYWKWAIPGYGLLVWLLLLKLWNLRRGPWRTEAVAGLAGVSFCLVLAFIRIAPVPAAETEPAKMLVFLGDTPTWDDAYFGDFTLRDSRGVLRNVYDVRAVPVPGGMRVFGLRRPFTGPVTIQQGNGNKLPGGLLTATPERWAEELTVGRPCWLVARLCGDRPRNRMFPKVSRDERYRAHSTVAAMATTGW